MQIARRVAWALGPAAIAFAIERAWWAGEFPWSLFYPAVLISAVFGGVAACLTSVVVSVALVWTFLIDPKFVLLKQDPVELTSALVFIAVGMVVSTLSERERRARRSAAHAATTMRQVNEHLKRAVTERRMFAALVENSSDFIGFASPGGVPVYINPAGRRLVGLPGDVSLAETRVPDFFSAETRPIVENEILPVLFESGYWEGESHYRHWQTGRAIPVWLTAFSVREPGARELLGVATITRDMSLLKQARDELEAANERWRNATLGLVEAQRVAHVGSWTYDVATDTVKWSDELFRIFGRTPGQPVPRLHGPEQIYTSESLRALEAAVAKIRRDGEPYEIELEAVRPDNQVRILASRGAARRNAAGDVVEIMGTAQDVTELRRLQQLREEWISIIAHDLRQPISVISMSAELLPDLHHGPANDPALDVVRRIGNAARGLSRMVNDMLDASRIEAHRLSLDRVWIAPKTLIDMTVANLEPIIGAVSVNVSIEGDLPRVCADPGRIQQVLGNLISNAIKYGDTARGIEIRARGVPGGVSIGVINGGKGLAPEEVRTLFNRFSRTHRTRTSKTEGLGLGLYIAKGLIAAHGGRLWCESVPDRETAFTFTLPTTQESGARAAAA